MTTKAKCDAPEGCDSLGWEIVTIDGVKYRYCSPHALEHAQWLLRLRRHEELIWALRRAYDLTPRTT